MRDRRMFSLAIVGSDAFLDMSIEAQALYFHLALHADNRGYINGVRRIISSIDGLNLGHLNELINKKFILDRGVGLYLVKHWYIHNDIPHKVFDESCYADDLNNLYFDINNAYTTRKTERPVMEVIRKKKPLKEIKNKEKGNQNNNQNQNENKNKINGKDNENNSNKDFDTSDDDELF